MASIPLATTAPLDSDTAVERVSVKLPRERAATSGWRHLVFGSGPFCYRLLRFSQRNRR